jgi:hypothetical protein
VETYRFDTDHANMIDSNDRNELDDTYLVEQIQNLLAPTSDGRSILAESIIPDHIIHTRLAVNRRPGLLRLKKSD